MKHIYKIITLFVRFIITASGYLYSQTTDTISLEIIDNNLESDFWKAPRIVFSPFPTAPLSLVQPLDSASTIKNIINLNLGNKQLVITLSNDFGIAREAIIENITTLNWDGGFYRKDIGHKVIK